MIETNTQQLFAQGGKDERRTNRNSVASLRHVSAVCSGSYFSHRGCFIGEVCEMVMERFMKDEQPEALIRADELEAIGAESSLARAMAAHTIRLQHAELHRLHEVNAELIEALNDLVNEVTMGSCRIRYLLTKH